MAEKEADIVIKVDLPEDEEEKHPHASVSLQIRKTLEGNLSITDHEDINIVLVPTQNKIVALSKEHMSEDVYVTQNRLFDYLAKKGVIMPETVQGSNIFGAMEAKIPENDSVDVLQVALFVIDKFIEEEKPFYDRDEKYKDDVEDWLLEPDDEHSTDLDWAEKTHQPRKGVQNRWPGSTAAYGLTGMYRA